MNHPERLMFVQLNRYIWAMAIFWSLIVFLSLTWNWIHSELNVQENARIQARTAYQKDILYRRWNSLHGGVFVFVGRHATPNPYLSAEEREIMTISGRRLALINPAYMLRMIYDLERASTDIRGRISSLKPIRPENAPDAWEAAALRGFRIEGQEASGIATIDGTEYMRLMRPLVTERSCLKCHEKEGYKEGDIRGGISVSIAMAPLRAALKPYRVALIFGHVLLWLFGCGGIGLAASRLRRQIRQRKAIEGALRESEERSRVLVENAPFGLSIMRPDQRFEYFNPKFIETFGYTLADIPDKTAWFEKAYPNPGYRDTVRKIWTADTCRPMGDAPEIDPKTFTVRGNDGRDRVIRFRNVPLKDGRQLLTYEDISKQVAAEDALRRSEENLRLLSSGLLAAQEKERRRIAYALHDELAQDLAVLTIEVKCIEEGLSADQTGLREACRKTHLHIIDIIENTRRLSQGLSPALLEDLGLSAAIRRMIEDFSAQTGIDVSLEMADMDHCFRPETEVIVYRIFQEAFTNIRKHAEATRVTVTVVLEDGEMTISIADNGRGFRPQVFRNRRCSGKGLGLIAMEERVRMLGRTLHKSSDDGKGMRLVFAAPLDRACGEVP
ncbi:MULTISPECIES: c-type heme family protein [Desulfococcus]|jgi:PAS domain S-box-containing protein|uniref:Oxygen sensor histidine kinase NreB n=1 Tax=Desulfococcus multivorans DSM 2059 TaxID=1121405 RepID=S7U1H9_DESML|nr:DUF3365 domain-containing protein [Desulfococcus multivorans]AOY58479.1 putative PAS/PAC sensor hybrid histidine kinase [Desulfococcus multivorans]AQV00794.1 hypothetical protein B2D07_08450 [Desulfococcus multivorans]EPR43266.1 multi-sensor signal transduction histidine kinase [Desulfococcus multivorans DSM 2059]MDX9817291.1 DUF3365 domain-containing protein [Desulfococcus multivorans]SJZ41602.1 PAS domain S-box-containing protein [Desulfococcus multivorans DSM 2059]